MYALEARKVHAYYGALPVLRDVNLALAPRTVTAFIGPSGCGKSTLLRLFNRMNDFIAGFRHEGQVLVDGTDIYSPGLRVEELRQRVGMVFQKPNPFPKSIAENVVYGLKLQGITSRHELAEATETALKQAALWDEVKQDLGKSALALSGGQQQRLCLARTLAVAPAIILMDEPASALDPISTAKIEELIAELKQRYTIVIVTHNLAQAARVSDHTAFFNFGQLIEYAPTPAIFQAPTHELTKRYVAGKFG
ncbi:phosphate ABC transporter ATP-binding protein PstB [Hymenobacter seoulensis]